jgi:hypothetical protein
MFREGPCLRTSRLRPSHRQTAAGGSQSTLHTRQQLGELYLYTLLQHAGLMRPVPFVPPNAMQPQQSFL